MTVLDVGQGLAVVVETHRHALVYDTGPRYHDEADAGGRIVAPFLRATGIRRLSAMIVTHQDTDHSGGALTLLVDGARRLVRRRRCPTEHAIRRAARALDGARARALRGRAAMDVGRRALRGPAADGRALRDAAAEAERPVVRRADRIRAWQRPC